MRPNYCLVQRYWCQCIGASVLVPVYWCQCIGASVLVPVYWCQCIGASVLVPVLLSVIADNTKGSSLFNLQTLLLLHFCPPKCWPEFVLRTRTERSLVRHRP